MKRNPIISVVMSVYNETEKMLDESIMSIINQTFSNFEMIIVNDNPENTQISKVLSMYSEFSFIRIITNERNLGLVPSLNRAIDESEGAYIARMDADDIALPNRLQREFEYLSEKGLDLVSSFALKMDESGQVIEEWRPSDFEMEHTSELLKTHNFIIHPTVIFKKNNFRYREIIAAEDYDLWLRYITSDLKVAILPEYLLKYRVRAKSITMSNHLIMDLSTQYVKKLNHQRRHSKDRTDSYSLKNYDLFLKKRNYLKYRDSYNDDFSDYEICSKKIKHGNFQLIFSFVLILKRNPLFFYKIMGNVTNRLTRCFLRIVHRANKGVEM